MVFLPEKKKLIGSALRSFLTWILKNGKLSGVLWWSYILTTTIIYLPPCGPPLGWLLLTLIWKRNGKAYTPSTEDFRWHSWLSHFQQLLLIKNFNPSLQRLLQGEEWICLHDSKGGEWTPWGRTLYQLIHKLQFYSPRVFYKGRKDPFVLILEEYRKRKEIWKLVLITLELIIFELRKFKMKSTWDRVKEESAWGSNNVPSENWDSQTFLPLCNRKAKSFEEFEKYIRSLSSLHVETSSSCSPTSVKNIEKVPISE